SCVKISDRHFLNDLSSDQLNTIVLRKNSPFDHLIVIGDRKTVVGARSRHRQSPQWNFVPSVPIVAWPFEAAKSLQQLKGPGQGRYRAAADIDFELPWLENSLFLVIVEGQVVGRQRKLDGLRLSRRQVNAAKALQFSHRPRDAAHQVPHIELH